MSEENEDVLIVKNQSLDVDEQKKKDILNVIESYNSFQEAIEKLEKEKLIWYLIGPLREDEEVRKQINSKWEADFQQFEQSVKKTQDEIHSKLESSLLNQSFLVYSTKANDFNIRFENKEEPVKISDILRASSEGEVYHISLGGDNQITASKKNGNERHYDFTGSGSSKMTINWQAKDSEGNSIDCSMTIEVGSDGIQKVIDEPKFGNLELTDPLLDETKNEILKLVEQNKEVFINGKTLYQAFTDMGKNVDNQPMQEEETFIRNPPESPQPPTPDSSGYFSPRSTSTPSSRRSSFSSVSEFNVEEARGQGEDELENKEKELESRIKELEEENKHLRKENAELKKLNQRTVEESDRREGKLIEENQALQKEIIELITKLEKSEKELYSKNQDIEQLKQQISILEQSQEDKNARIADLKSQLKDQESEIQSTNGANKELQENLRQSEAELNKLRAENTTLKENLEKIEKDLKDNYGKQLAGKEKELTDAKNLLNEEQLKNKRLAEELKNLQKEKADLEKAIQQPSGKSLADEIEEVNEKKDEEMKQKDKQIQQIMKEKGKLEEESQEEIDRLKQQLKERESVLTDTREELKSVKETLGQLQSKLEQEEVEATAPKTRDQSTQAVDKSSNKKISGLRRENQNLTRDKQTISEQLKQRVGEIEDLKEILKQLQERNKQLKQKATKNVGLDALSSTDQKETKEMEVQTDVKKDDFHDVYYEGGKYVRTEFSNPSLTPAEVVEVEIRPQSIMDWPVPIPDDKPEKLIDPLKPTKVNTELSDPSLTSVEDPEKSRHKA
ncbi:MAG: hypothetical protein LBJ80_02320 [Rickettsiales bacterium]|jgi:hypothetical protein|nr:hypothetical protein [Rickettsiales bacterium]MDR1261236.1 hypothetical protein [Rickettsiales bacterium]